MLAIKLWQLVIQLISDIDLLFAVRQQWKKSISIFDLIYTNYQIINKKKNHDIEI